MKTINFALLVLTSFLTLGGICQTLDYEEGEKTIELETASPKKWFKNPPKKIVMAGIRLQFDNYAAQSSDGATMIAKLNGLNQELLNKIGNQFYEDFKKAHEAKGYTVDVLDKSKWDANKKVQKKVAKGKVILIEGGKLVDYSDVKKNKNRSVIIYPDKVPFIYSTDAPKGPNSIEGHASQLMPVMNMDQPLGNDVIGAFAVIRVNFFDFMKAWGVAGQTGLFISNKPEGWSSLDCSIHYFVYPKNANGFSGVIKVHPNHKLSVKEADCFQVTSKEKETSNYDGSEDLSIEYDVVDDLFLSYTNALLNAFAEKSAGLFDNHLKTINSK